MGKQVQAMKAQRMGASPRKAMGMGEIPMKRGGRVKDADEGMKSGGKVKSRKRGGRC